MTQDEKIQEILGFLEVMGGAKAEERLEIIRQQFHDPVRLHMVYELIEQERCLQLSWGAYPHRMLSPTAENWACMERARAIRERLKDEFDIDVPAWQPTHYGVTKSRDS